MSINWGVRFKNKVWLTTFITFIISTVYQFLEVLEITPAIAQDTIAQVIVTVLQVLSLLGIIVDPTTKGISDSQRAMGYDDPA